MSKPFTTKQQMLIQNGTAYMGEMSDIIKRALGITTLQHRPKRHTYLKGPPGVGKSWTTDKLIAANNLDIKKVTGTVSANNICIMLATQVYCRPNDTKVFWFDDCDDVLHGSKTKNLLKGAMDTGANPAFAYNVNMTNTITNGLNSDDPNQRLQAMALQEFLVPGCVGPVIPTHNIEFFITSNLSLKSQSDVDRLKAAGKSVLKYTHEAAIYDRTMYEEFDLNADDTWGCFASSELADTTAKITIDQKHDLLQWMYDNWLRIKSPSMRTLKDREAEMLNFPNTYTDHWERSLSRKT